MWNIAQKNKWRHNLTRIIFIRRQAGRYVHEMNIEYLQRYVDW